MSATDLQRAVEAVWRIESACGSPASPASPATVGLAEDLAQEALLAALEQWPRTGVRASERPLSFKGVPEA